MTTKKTHKTKRKAKGVSDLSPKPERAKAVKGGKPVAFGKFGDIKGESTEKDHKDWVV